MTLINNKKINKIQKKKKKNVASRPNLGQIRGSKSQSGTWIYPPKTIFLDKSITSSYFLSQI